MFLKKPVNWEIGNYRKNRKTDATKGWPQTPPTPLLMQHLRWITCCKNREIPRVFQHEKKTHSSSIFKIFNSFQTKCVGRVHRALKRVLIYFWLFERYKMLYPTLPAWFTNHSSHQRRDQMATCFCLPVGICNSTSTATCTGEKDECSKISCWLSIRDAVHLVWMKHPFWFNKKNYIIHVYV